MKRFLLKVFILSLIPSFVYSEVISYEVKYGFIPAGSITIRFEPKRVIVEGKSGGLVGLFYHYELYMVYNLENETDSFLYEKENSKERKYHFQKILQKKAWLPIVIKLLKKERIPRHLKVGNLKIDLEKVEENSYHYRVEGSKRTKEVIINGWKAERFPKAIEIKTIKGSLILTQSD